MKIRILLISLFLFFAVCGSSQAQNDTGAGCETPSFEDSIRIDGRTYRISPDFIVPANIDIDSPVKLIFSENTHELLKIERMTDDSSDNDQLEYHFGIVNAVSRADVSLEYRVYVDGIGYLFSADTRIDERFAFLDKYASVALVTKNGRVIMCRVISSNTAVPEKDIFLGMVEQAVQTDDAFIISINGTDHVLTPETETVGTVMVPGTWVFGYETGRSVKFISVITDRFPDPADIVSFQGFAGIVGNIRTDGSFYITVGESAFRVLPDAAAGNRISPGDYVSGYRLGNDILLISAHYADSDQVSGTISGITVNAFQIGGRIIGYDEETLISGSFSEGKDALVSLAGDYAERIYILPDSYSDFDYRTVSGVLSGIGVPDADGRRAVRLDEEVFYVDSETGIHRNLAYDEVGVALYKGMNQISIIDVLPKPDDKGQKFSGRISGVRQDPSGGEMRISIGDAGYILPMITAYSGFSDPSRLGAGTVVEGYAYGNEILAVRLIRGAGLLGLLNPPWVEYALAGGIVSVIFIWLFMTAVRNRPSWHTGYPEPGSGNTVILNEEDGRINSYAADESMFGTIMMIRGKSITVKIRSGKIVDIR